MNHLREYKLYGNYRMGSGRLVKSINVIDSFNENNAIITSNSVSENRTTLLPWFPNNPKDLLESLKKGSITPRILTAALIENNDMPNIYAINTHLDYQLKSVQERQMKNILKIIRILSKVYPIALTGDFNMETKDEHFNDFINELNNIGLKRVEVNDKTNASKFPNKKAIDHIFIPNNWTIQNSGLIKDENSDSVTDHIGVYADVKVR